MARSQPASLVILAAGLGSRYGGNKQLATIADSGRPLLFFSVMDAWHAGIRDLVLIVNDTVAAVLERDLVPLLPPDLRVTLVLQRLSDLPDEASATEGRVKPWGTGHALWCARHVLHQPFIVINADDYYGRAALDLLLSHFNAGSNWAMVSYRLADTLSDHGAVNRGLCRISGQRLQRIDECLSIQRRDGALSGLVRQQWVELQPDSAVSMNIWGFTPTILPRLEQGMSRFLRSGEAVGGEYYLPEEVENCIANHGEEVQVYSGTEPWVGITYAEDLSRAAEALRDHPDLHAAGQA